MSCFSNTLLVTQIHPTALDWNNRVLTNGGTQPSYNTMIAASNFLDGLDRNGLTSLMKAVNIYAPESLLTCQTPLIATYGSGSWTNTGYLAANLTVNGMAGGASKYFQTGIVPSTAFSSDGSGGVTLYVYTGNSNNENDCGIWASAASNQMAMYVNYGTSTLFDSWNVNGGRISAANAAWQGYVSFNRTSTSAAAIYKARSDVSHTTLVSGSGQTGIGSRPTTQLFVGRMNGSTTNSTKGFSFFAAHDGLTLGQSATFYPLVQTLRQTIGGGYR